MSIFSRKHYKVIAKALRELADWDGRDIIFDNVVLGLADMFEKDNPKFKRLLFIQKCQEDEK